MTFDFTQPLFLLLLAIIPVLLYMRYRKKAKRSSSYLNYSNISFLKNIKQSWRIQLASVQFPLRMLILLLLIIALAGPRTGISYQQVQTSGIDIMMVLDISSSMKSLDFEPKNRLDMAKEVVADFIDKRVNDRLGLVVFSGGAFTQCPLTIDHELLKSLLEKVRIGMIEDGTAIGNALAVGVSRLLDSTAKSKVIILLTDGENNRGAIAPVDAAKLAADNYIKVYTIGAGKEGRAKIERELPDGRKVMMEAEVKIDEEVLTKIAETTGGKYFRAHNTESLREIYKIINDMETTVIKPKFFVSYSPRYFLPLVAGLLLLLFSVFIELFITRKIP